MVAVSATVSKTKAKRAKLANRALYAPKPRAAQPKPATAGLVPDAALKRITRRVLEELRTPGLIPSEVIRSALDEALKLAEAAVGRKD